MKTHNRLDKSFGPSGSFAGLIIFIAGAVYTYFSLTGIVLIIFGAFFGFTHTGVLIDFESKRARFSNYLFGIIPAGRWIDIQPEMKLEIRKSHTAWRTFSRGNRTLDTEESDFRLILTDSEGNEIMPLKKFSDTFSAKQETEIFRMKLNL